MLLPLSAYGQACGELTNNVGPWDYTDPDVRKCCIKGHWSALSLVEEYHFYREIEQLTLKDHTGKVYAESIVGDLDYILRAFPNHHRALNALTKLEREVGRLPQIQNYSWPTSSQCYFERALRFRPKDPIVHLIMGTHLHLQGKLQEALQAYQRAEKLFPDIADLQYNLGLLYLDMGNFVLAKQHAEKAYQLGHKQANLYQKLKQAGHWN